MHKNENRYISMKTKFKIVSTVAVFTSLSCSTFQKVDENVDLKDRTPSALLCKDLMNRDTKFLSDTHKESEISSKKKKVESESKIDPNTIQSKQLLIDLVAKINPKKDVFIKDTPTIGFKITSSRFEDIPSAIRDHLGGVDQTTYTPEYLEKNIGSVISLQVNGDKPDFYVIGKSTFDSKYKPATLEQVQAKNKKYFDKLDGHIGALLGDANVIAVLKVAPVEMVSMLDIGFKKEDKITIESPWGEQTKPAGQDAYLVLDSSNQYYMVNVDPHGLPISYIPQK